MKEAIILAGGFGTRLQSVVNDRPKCMALIASKPFLYYLFEYLEKNKFKHVVLSLGYKHEIVLDWLKTVNYSFELSYVVENEPLGTGGAIKYAASKIREDVFFVLNGDTFFDIDIVSMTDFYLKNKADIVLALKPMENFDRYGCVVLGLNNHIKQFLEKQDRTQGLINGGVYLINKSIFENGTLADKFSFEKDILEKKLDRLDILGYTENSYFIDIGIPSDYNKADIDFRSF